MRKSFNHHYNCIKSYRQRATANHLNCLFSLLPAPKIQESRALFLPVSQSILSAGFFVLIDDRCRFVALVYVAIVALDLATFRCFYS